MKRRDFLKSTFLFAAISTIAAKATGIMTNAIAGDVYVTPGKLGYKEVSPKQGKNCLSCKWYKSAGKDSGDCTLPAMKNAMKAASAPKVKSGAYCNMWAKKA